MSSAPRRGRSSTGRAAPSDASPTGRAARTAGATTGRGIGRAGSATGRSGRSAGYATAELAASLPAVVLLLLAGLTAVNAVSTQTRCIDAARDVALALARGERSPTEHLPPDARIAIDTSADQIFVTVTAPVVGGLTVSGRAVAARETP